MIAIIDKDILKEKLNNLVVYHLPINNQVQVERQFQSLNLIQKEQVIKVIEDCIREFKKEDKN